MLTQKFNITFVGGIVIAVYAAHVFRFNMIFKIVSPVCRAVFKPTIPVLNSIVCRRGNDHR